MKIMMFSNIASLNLVVDNELHQPLNPRLRIGEKIHVTVTVTVITFTTISSASD